MTAQEIISAGLYNTAVELMDDEIREELHRSGNYTTEAEFLAAYMAEHEKKYGAPFTI